jgi:hypothetical protein
MKNPPCVDEAAETATDAPLGLISFVLTENRNDVLSLGMFVYYVSRHPWCEGRPLRRTALRYLENALAAGLLTVGDLVGDEHRPWPVSYTNALKRIKAAWPANDDPAFDELRDVCWLANTAKGNQAAELRASWSSRAVPSRPHKFPLHSRT